MSLVSFISFADETDGLRRNIDGVLFYIPQYRNLGRAIGHSGFIPYMSPHVIINFRRFPCGLICPLSAGLVPSVSAFGDVDWNSRTRVSSVSISLGRYSMTQI